MQARNQNNAERGCDFVRDRERKEEVADGGAAEIRWSQDQAARLAAAGGREVVAVVSKQKSIKK